MIAPAGSLLVSSRRTRGWALGAGVVFAAYLFVLAFPRLQRFEGPVETS